MRKGKPPKREFQPDPRYHDELVTRFVNNLILRGKKNLAFSIFYNAIDMVGEKTKAENKPPLEIWKKALDNVAPHVEVKSRRVGGATFQVPMEVRPDRKITLSMKNLIRYAKQRTGKSMSDKLAAEIISAYREEGGAFKKKEDMHRMAEANKAFAHFRF
jgi:small subunit ribosomal protein S7